MGVTNKKGFKEVVQEYVKGCLSDENYQELSFQLNEVAEEFKSWWIPYNQKRYPNQYNAFREWLLSLPSSFNYDYWNQGIIENYNNWFIQVGEVPKPMKEEKVIDYYFHFVAREFEALCKKEGVQF